MIPEFKVCNRCKINKHKSEYYVRSLKAKNQSLKSECKKCARIKLITCIDCGVKKLSKTRRCRKCATKNSRIYTTIGEVKNKYKKYGRCAAFNIIRIRARSFILGELGKDPICQKCGYSKHVQICHIKPISSFQDNTPIDIVNSINNLMILCPNCHWELDHPS